MAWSYRKRFKIIPGVHLNVSKSGVSATIGVKGLSVTYGSKGTYANVGILGTGIYNRFKINQRLEIRNDIETIKNKIERNRWHKFFLCIVYCIYKINLLGLKLLHHLDINSFLQYKEIKIRKVIYY